MLASVIAEHRSTPIHAVELGIPQHHDKVWVRSYRLRLSLVVPEHTSFRGTGDVMYCTGGQDGYVFDFFHMETVVCVRCMGALCLLDDDGMNNAAILAVPLLDQARQRLEQNERPNAALWFANAATQLNALLWLTKE